MEAKTLSSPPRGNGKSKLDQARAKRQTSTTQAVAATVSTRLAPAPTTRRPMAKNTIPPADVVARANSRINTFFEHSGRGLSWSALVEVALRELLERDDFDEVIERHGARARRPDVK